MERIWILGVGWRQDDLTLGAVKRLRSGNRVILRTGRCECAEWLKEENIVFETLDSLYDECENFDELIEQTAEAVLAVAENEAVVYCVNDLSDKTSALICEKAGEAVELIPGVSEGAQLIPFAGEDVRIISAADADLFEPDVHLSTLIRELDNPMLASDVKLKLSEHYPDEMDIYLCDAAGRIQKRPLCDLDRLDAYDHRLCALIPAVRELDRLERYNVRHLEEIMMRLRDFDGCPWDREQTHETLRQYLVEEAYEAVDAINRDDTDALYDELGDVLLQVIFHSDIARQYGEFTFGDVTTAICKKMLRRHPHVFGKAIAETSGDVQELWSDIKRKEKNQKNLSDMLKDIPESFPALLRAEKVCKRLTEHPELIPAPEEAWTAWNKEKNAEALGDFLIALVNCARKESVAAELSLNESIERMIRTVADKDISV